MKLLMHRFKKVPDAVQLDLLDLSYLDALLPFILCINPDGTITLYTQLNRLNRKIRLSMG